jgi:hypothetical protein
MKGAQKILLAPVKELTGNNDANYRVTIIEHLTTAWNIFLISGFLS